MSVSRSVLVFLFIFCLCDALSAGSLSGRVSDPYNRPVSGVRLMLSGESGRQATQLSQEDGGYRFDHLAPGTYSIRIFELGFDQTSERLVLRDGDDRVHNLTVHPDVLKETVVVTATRTESSQTLLGNSVSVIGRDEIELRQTLTVGDLLRTVPGVHILQTGQPGSVTSLFIRGGESDYSRILVDGMPINQPGGSLEISNLGLTNVERIEVVRGPQSALYGSDAISGVIQLFSRKPPREGGRPQGELRADLGNHGQGTGALSLFGGNKRFGLTTDFRHFETDNTVPNAFFRENSFASRASVSLSPSSNLSVIARTDRSRAGVPGPVLFGPPDLEENYRKRDNMVGLGWGYTMSDAWKQTVFFSHSATSLLSEDLVDSGFFIPAFGDRTAAFPSFDYPYSYLNSTRRNTLDYQSDVTVAGHLLAAGLDWEQERGTVGDVRASRNNAGVYLQDQFFLGERWALTGGLRLDQNGSFGFAATPRVSVSYLLRSSQPESFWGITRPKFNAGIGIKEPNFLESYSQNPYFRGNPDLKPERTKSAEVGIEQHLSGGRIQTEVNAFYNHFLNQIDLVTVDFQTFEGRYINIGKSQAWGIEHSSRVSIFQDVHLAATYTYLNTRILRSANPTHPVLREGARLLRRPTHSGAVSGGWTRDRYRIYSSLVIVSDRADNDFYGLGLLDVDGYTRWDLSAGCRVTEALDVYGTFQNVLDRRYQEALGYPALPFNFRAGIKVRF